MTEKPKLSADEQREIFRRFLYETGLTLVAFGKLCGLTNPMLSMFENGKRELSDKAWGRVHDAMNKVVVRNRARLEVKRAKVSEAAAKLPLTGYLSEMFLPNSREIVDRTRIAKSALRVKQVLDQIAERPSGKAELKALVEDLIGILGENLEERKRWLLRLQNLSSVDDPVIAEIMESFRREIETLEKQLAGKTSVTPAAEESAD
jgi:hypothetical protein